MQRDLIQPAALALTPPGGLAQPRLWIRRFVIWQDASTKIRDFQLRPGLNVIWSPDGGDTGPEIGRVIGHGAGKTMFCRLIRHCLGEARFADDEQRQRIAEAFPEGAVGAEILIDGVPWAVYRTIGVRRRHVALANGDLDAVASGEGSITGIEPLIRAIEGGPLGAEVSRLARLPSAPRLGLSPWHG